MKNLFITAGIILTSNVLLSTDTTSAVVNQLQEFANHVRQRHTLQPNDTLRPILRNVIHGLNPHILNPLVIPIADKSDDGIIVGFITLTKSTRESSLTRCRKKFGLLKTDNRLMTWKEFEGQYPSIAQQWKKSPAINPQEDHLLEIVYPSLLGAIQFEAEAKKLFTPTLPTQDATLANSDTDALLFIASTPRVTEKEILDLCMLKREQHDQLRTLYYKIGVAVMQEKLQTQGQIFTKS